MYKRQITNSNGTAWQIYETDEDSARAGFGDLLSGFVSGMAALELASMKKISTESFAKYVLIHSYGASQCSKGSSASKIGEEVAKLVRQIKSRQMSWKWQFTGVFYSFKHITKQLLLQIWSGS